jgi:UDP-N-acetylmuramate dehydrogenase
VTLLADYTTLGLGGPAKAFTDAPAEAALIDAVQAADTAGEPVLILGGGSNLVIADEGFPGSVVHVNTRGVGYAAAADGQDGVDVTVAAGEDWDDVVAAVVAEGLAGVECLSGIPGRAGATPIQNVGAYGHEVAEVITSVRVFDRRTSQIQVIPNGSCHFAYRTSFFKRHPARYAVLGVTFRLTRDARSMPVKYAELAAELDVRMGERAGVGEVRSAVLKIRARKGMVLNPGDPDTRSAGSFFTNPLLDAEQFARVTAAAAVPAPRFDAGDGKVKVPAAWLIENAGFGKGYGAPGRARVSSKHTLALINAGGATTTDLLTLAREIRDGVRATFGVTLDPEPTLIGATL